jgi:hypothetical protein
MRNRDPRAVFERKWKLGHWYAVGVVMLMAVSPGMASAANVAIKGAGSFQPRVGQAGATNPIKFEVTDYETAGLNATQNFVVTANPPALP